MTRDQIISAAEAVGERSDYIEWHWRTQRELAFLGIPGVLTYDDFRSIMRAR